MNVAKLTRGDEWAIIDDRRQWTASSKYFRTLVEVAQPFDLVLVPELPGTVDLATQVAATIGAKLEVLVDEYPSVPDGATS